ncbi:MAG: sigma 54-interacting transcriptional regulator [Desulfovermiculus sp.]|nr:sigma 54-interacting transcriptional regulator [Desulfovermiculus sp.]
MRMMPSSLKGTLLLAVTSLVFGTCLLVAVLASQRYAEALGANLQAQAENQAHSLSLQISDLILMNDLIGLHKALTNHVQSHSHADYAFVLRQGQILAHTFEQGVPQGLINANSPSDRNNPGLKRILSQNTDKDYLDIVWPIFEGKAGTLRMGFDRGALFTRMQELWLEIALVTLAILIPAVIGGLFFMRRITKPLESLVQATQAMDRGQFDVRVQTQGKDEFASLAKSFNNMAARLGQYTTSLQKQAENLEQMHSQLSTAYEVIRNVSAQTRLDAIGKYLLGQLKEILTCPEMVLLLCNPDKSRLVKLSDKGGQINHDQQDLEALETALQGLPSHSVCTSNRFAPTLIDQSISESPVQAIIPFDSHENIFGALVIACPGDCECDFKEADLVTLIIAHTAESIFRAARQEEERRDLQSLLEGHPVFGNIVGKDPAMQKVFRLIEEVAPTGATALITGESGTGKELVARAIHDKSPRKDRPFVVIDCSAFPSTLIESELFGHTKGAFTGATNAKAGRFEQADGGTVFLDEIGEIPFELQVKLLRVLQTQRFERLGGRQTIEVDMRIIAATNKDLLEEVRAGRFREDLYYRLEVIPIHLPPLRSRGNDVALLARHFLTLFSVRLGKQMHDISPQAIRLILRYPWPGNVRELENVMEQAVIMARGDRILPGDLPDKLLEPSPQTTPEKDMWSHERDLLVQTLDECGWNKKLAAEKLGIGRSTLYSKLRRYNLQQQKE